MKCLAQILLYTSILLLSHPITSQKIADNRKNYVLHMSPSTTNINIDGQLDEEVWLHAEHTSMFHKVTPTDEGFPQSHSEVMMAYDDENLYIGIVCFDTIPGKRPIESLRRDFSFGSNDNFIVFIDTYNDQTNGFAFGISAAGAQWDGIQANGGFVSLNWDTKWKSAVQNFDDKWVAEFAIPFKSIRYKDRDTEWGINFSRLDLKTGEKSSCAPVPRQFQTANLAFTGTLKWEQPFPPSGTNYSLIPYVFTRATKDISNESKTKVIGKLGLDAKIALSTSLNLDLTVNPDFSQVEVDQQRTNLERFELFFPEKRQFFLENSDLFSSLGEPSNRPFFSRRIGLNNPVKGGIRLSGKIGNKSRIGIMNMQTGTDNDPASNFSVGVFQQQIFGRSNLSIFMVNKQITGNKNGDLSNYNRVAGFDFNLASSDNLWTGKLFYHHSFYRNSSSNSFTTSGKITYETSALKIQFQSSYIDDDYKASVGFVRRKGVYNLKPLLKYNFFPKNRNLTRHGPGIEMDVFIDQSATLRDQNVALNYQFTWADRSNFKIEAKDVFIKLQAAFDPTHTKGKQLEKDDEFHWNTISAAYESGPTSLFNYKIQVGIGGFFNGNRFSTQTDFSYRVQPYGKLGIVTTFDHINLPLPYNSPNFLLIGPKLDLTFTDHLFLTTFIQYNNQIDNVNMNIRMQWRFAPGSDLFIVYTQNSYPDQFVTKNRGLVAKMTYWFN